MRRVRPCGSPELHGVRDGHGIAISHACNSIFACIELIEEKGIACRNVNSSIVIMFVCHGNICRSTMAEFVMRDMVARAGLGDRIAIASCATTNDEIGNDTHPGTQRVLDAHGIAHRAEPPEAARAADYGEYHLFIGMDDENIRDMRRILKGDPQGQSAQKLLRSISDGGDADSANSVADPWFTGDFGNDVRSSSSRLRGVAGVCALGCCARFSQNYVKFLYDI